VYGATLSARVRRVCRSAVCLNDSYGAQRAIAEPILTVASRVVKAGLGIS
jgi:hypothetical protein